MNEGSQTARLSLLARQDWNRVGQELMAFTCWQARRFGLDPQRLPRGQTAMDLVQDAIDSLFSGVRVWEPTRTSLAKFLKGVVQSRLSHLAASGARKYEVRDTTPGGATVDTGDPMARATTEVCTHLKVRALYAAVSDNGDLVALLDAIRSGVEPRPRYLAEVLSVSVGEVNRRLRQLRRRAARLKVPAPSPSLVATRYREIQSVSGVGAGDGT